MYGQPDTKESLLARASRLEQQAQSIRQIADGIFCDSSGERIATILPAGTQTDEASIQFAQDVVIDMTDAKRLIAWIAKVSKIQWLG